MDENDNADVLSVGVGRSHQGDSSAEFAGMYRVWSLLQ
jgi:hypothetical protein